MELLFFDGTMKILLYLSIILFLGLINKEPQMIRIPLEFSNEFPILKVEIEGTTHALILDLGGSCELALKPSVLDAISAKERVGSRQIMDLDGQKHTVLKYLLQRVWIQNGQIIHAIAEQDDRILQANISGRIGRNTLQTRNLLLDFSRSLFLILKNSEDLKTENYSISDFQEVPFTPTRWGAVFSIETDFGTKRFFINTAAARSGIRDLQEKNGRVETLRFKIGRVDLGNTDLEIVNITSNINDVDGYLGVDFFMKNVVFLDFQKNKAFIHPVK